jgi:hypothetical protein
MDEAMASKKKNPIDPGIKKLLGFPITAVDSTVLKAWKEASSRVCKPCWELKYCPYGPLVEDFPLLPPLRADVIEGNRRTEKTLDTGMHEDGRRITAKQRHALKENLEYFGNPENFPEYIPEEIAAMSCTVFGHICPVVFSAEPFTETTELRRMGRNVPAHILMRVARRDNYKCQVCATTLHDNEIEFDHIIPVAKGGSSEEHNIRVTCFDCNRQKSAKVDLSSSKPRRRK